MAFVLIALSAATAALPHRHALVPGERAASSDVRVTSVTTCDELSGNGAQGHESPCGACARQDGLGLAPAMKLAAAPRTETALLPSNPFIAEQSAQGPNVCLRGPPASPSVG